MKKITLLLLTFFTFSHALAEDKAEVEKLLKTIFKPEALKNSKFEASGCKYQKEKWLALLIGGPSFEEKIKFGKDCDIEGSFTPKMATKFPVNLKIRNFPDYTKLATQTLITLTLEMQPKLSIKMTNVKLSGDKKEIDFDINYGATINPLRSEIIEKDLGGELYIRTIDGKIIGKKYPLKGYLK